MKKFGFIFFVLPLAFSSIAQPAGCVLKPPQFTIHFGAGDVRDPNTEALYSYRRVSHSCPSDGYYSFASYTSSCFSDDWHTVAEDHTSGDVAGNMLLVNAGREGARFFGIAVNGLKSNTVYELGLWLMNLCKPTKKCPFPLLPVLSIRLESPEGDVIANIATGELPRVPEPRWTQHRAYFTTPASASSLMLIMSDKNPSGCGNDFALDDVTFRECVKQPPPVTKASKTTPATKQSTTSKPPPPKTTQSTGPKSQTTKSSTLPKKNVETAQVIKPKTDSASKINAAIKQSPKINASPPPVLKTRENALVRQIETAPGDIKIEIYDNGEIDGDTISVYHNNALIRSHMRLSQKPISITLSVDPSQSHHEIIMVAENLGSIPPNTSVMIITTASNRYELNISSTWQKNAKVVFDLKK